uniref:Integral membrane protein, putative n=1 Tax=Theileria annulata TaxID=5874 RepID=A0A3B0MQ64_THEAN
MFKAQLFQAALSVTNYLQNSLLEEPRNDLTNQHDYHKKEREVNYNNPPNLLKSLFEYGRPFFRLDYSQALNNIRCLVLPIGKVKQLTPDLYIPSISTSTFMIASSVLLCIKSKTKMTFGDALSRTLTKFVLVNFFEILFLGFLLYFISYSNVPDTNDSNKQTVNYQDNQEAINQAYGHFTDYGNTYQTQFNVRNTGNLQNYGKKEDQGQGNTSAVQKTKIKLPHVLFVIGYKYVLINYFLFITNLVPLKINTIVSMVYVGISSLIFSIRSIKSLGIFQGNSSNPLIFIFPVFQPLFFYILLPASKI